MFDIPLHARSQLVKDLPTQVYIEVTNRCNSLCASWPLTYNHFDPYEPKHHLAWEDFRRIIDQFPRLDRAVLHGIGEPLLNKHLPHFVKHLKARDAWVLFNSNGLLLDERMFVLGNPHSMFWGLAYAYIFMNLAMLFIAPVFSADRLENRIRQLFILNGISGVVTLACAFLDSPPLYLLGSLVFWCPVFTAAAASVAALFNRTVKNVKKS